MAERPGIGDNSSYRKANGKHYSPPDGGSGEPIRILPSAAIGTDEKPAGVNGHQLAHRGGRSSEQGRVVTRTQQRPAVGARTGRPAPHQEPRRAAPADQERSAPLIRAAVAGVRQELSAVAGGERAPRASTGIRGVLNSVGLRLAPSGKEKRHLELMRRIRAPKDAMYAIAVLTLKGGAGRTTVTATLGQVFAKVRPDDVLAVDADPACGDLPLRTAVHPKNLSMVDLMEERDLWQRDSVARFMSTTDTDLQVLANGWRPDSDRVLEPEDIADIHEIASHYFSLLLWDGEVNLSSPMMRQVLAKSDAVVLLAEASLPGAYAAGNAIDWFRFHGFEGLLARTVLLVNETVPKTRVDMRLLMKVLARQQVKLHRIPFDSHLEEAREVDLDKLNRKTRRAFEQLAAMLADDFVIAQPPASAAAAR